jgi:hypothetical protein
MHSHVDGLIAGKTYIDYVTGTEHSAFLAYKSENGIITGGVIRVNTDEVQHTATRQNISFEDALKETVVHEVGHGVNATTDAHNIAVSPAALENYCYTREGEAAAFNFIVAMEDHQAGGNLQVAGVIANPNLYYDMLATYTALSATIDPRSNAFQASMVNYATTQFASDPNYQAACKAWAADPGKAALYIPPDDYATSGGSGSADGGNYDTPPDDTPTPPADGGDDGGGGDNGGGGGDGDVGACVSIDSLLPDGRLAGDITVGDEMQLADERTLEPGSGVVSYSQIKTAAGFRITTASGASLKCSDTAPIPTPEGLVLAPDLLGKQVAVRQDDEQASVRWEKVTAVDSIGQIQVQHITVGDKCFWAGEKPGSYILHHNLKDAGGGGGGDDPGDEDGTIAQSPNQARPAAIATNATAKPVTDKLPAAQEAAHASTEANARPHTDAGSAEAQHHAPVEVTLVGHSEMLPHHVMLM